MFSNWSDNGAQSHAVVVPASATTSQAIFSTPVSAHRQGVAGNAGLSPPLPASADGYYSSGTSVQFTATPAAGHAFSAFTSGVRSPGRAKPHPVDAALRDRGVCNPRNSASV